MMKELIKSVGSTVIGAGVGVVVRSMIKDNISSPSGIAKQFLLAVGTTAISGYVARKIKKEFGEQVDATFAIVEKINEEL